MNKIKLKILKYKVKIFRIILDFNFKQNSKLLNKYEKLNYKLFKEIV